MSKGFGGTMDSQIKTAQAALDRAAQRNGGRNLADVPDLDAMASSVGAGATELAKAISVMNPFVGSNEGGK